MDEIVFPISVFLKFSPLHPFFRQLSQHELSQMSQGSGKQSRFAIKEDELVKINLMDSHITTDLWPRNTPE